MFGPTVNLIFAVLVTGGVALWIRGRVRRGDRLIAAGFVVAVALVSYFGFRTIDRALYWTDPSHAQQVPEGWMTLGYLARSWHLRPEELAGALGVEPGSLRGLTLDEIATRQGVPVTALIDRLSARLAGEPPRPTAQP